jgi:hypothetical protein
MNFYIVLILAAASCGPGHCDQEQTQVKQFGEAEVKRLEDLAYKATTWAIATNGIQFGVRLAEVGPLPKDHCKVATFLYNASQKDRAGLLQPPHGSCFSVLVLRDASGKEVPRRRTGDRLCKAPPEQLVGVGRRRVLPSETPLSYEPLFDLRECFKLASPGAYTLEIRCRLYAFAEYPKYDSIDPPAVRLNVKITDVDLER